MFREEKKLKITDLIDMNLLQDLQDTFAKVMDVAAVTVGDEGYITKPSNFSDFCNMTREIKTGLSKCLECHTKWGKLSAEKKEPVIHTCSWGLKAFSVPIIVDGVHIASILGGQILTKNLDDLNMFKKNSIKLGIEEEKYMGALSKIKVIPMEKVKIAAHLLYIIANTISTIGHKNLELIKKNKKETFYKNIVETIRSSLDIDKTKKIIVNIIGKSINADRCFLMEYDKSSGKFLLVKDEYTASDKITKYEGSDVNIDIPNFIAEFKMGKYLVIDNKKIFIEGVEKDYSTEKDTIERINVHSAYGFPLFYKNSFIGVIGIHYLTKEHTASQEEIELLQQITSQISIALYQAESYKRTVIQAQREELIKNITEKIRSSLNTEETLSYICEEIAKIFDVQRVIVVGFDNPNNYNRYTVKKEYTTKPEIETIKNRKNFEKVAYYWTSNTVKKASIMAFDNIAESNTPQFFKKTYADMNVKSIIGIPIKKEHEIWGTLVLSDYNRTRHWNDEEKDLLNILSNQTYIAIKQAELFEQEKITAERETILRKTINILRSTLDAEEIKNMFAEIIRNYFTADRCLFCEYDKNSDKFLPFRIEKLKSDKVKSLAGTSTEENFPEFLERHRKGKNTILRNVEKISSKENLSKCKAIQSISKGDVKSDYGLLVKYKSQIMGIIIMHFTEDTRILTPDEFNFLQVLIDQVGIALYQAELYHEAQQEAKKEEFLRTITGTIRSSLDIDETKQKIVTAIGKAFNADRCFIAEYDKFDNRVLPITNEYLSSENIFSYMGKDVTGLAPDIIDILKKGENVVINNKEIFAKDYSKAFTNEKLAMEKYKDLSLFAFPLFYSGELVGGLTISYIDRNYEISEEETQMLINIADQIATAIHQARLYKITQTQAQRESLLRSITEKIRSSLNIDETLSYICEETAKVFGVQRSTIAIYKNLDDYGDLEVKKEYKDNSSIKGIEHIKNFRELASFWGNYFMKGGQTLTLDNVEDESVPELLRTSYINMGIKSLIGVVIKKGDKTWGQLVLSEYNRSRHWSTEDKNLLQTIADQIYMAINQSELFEQQKTTAQREKLLSSIMSKAIKTFDINEIKQLVSEIGKETKADRCYFVELDLKDMRGKPVGENEEYLSSPDIKSIVGYTFPIEDVKSFTDAHLNLKDLIVFDYESIINNENDTYSGTKNYAELFGLKSGIGIPFIYMNKLTAVLCIEYVKEKVLPAEDELDFLRILGNQIGMVFNQIKIFQETKKTAEREIILRKIIETVRSSLDIKEVKKNITKELCKALDADRCYFRSYDKINNFVSPPDSEYLSSPDTKSMLNIEASQESFTYFLDEVRKRKRGFYPIVVDEKLLKNEHLDSYMKSFDIKADYAMPIIDRQEEIVWLVIHYSKKDPKLSEDYRKLLETIAYQIDIALEQIRLYNESQKKAEREKAFSRIVNAIRSTLDIKEIKNKFVEETGKYFNAGRCFIYEYGQNIKSGVYSEYTSSPEIKKISEDDFEKPQYKYWEQAMFGSDSHIENFAYDMDKYIIDNNLENTPVVEHVREYNIKTAIGIPIFYAEQLYGELIIQYTDKMNILSKEDTDFIRRLADQAGIALHQAHLYEITQIQTQREILLRKIFEAMRSSLDIKIIKETIVNEVGKIINADICFIVAYESETDTFKVDEHSEYKVSPEQKSFVGLDPKLGNAQHFLKSFYEHREIIFSDIDKFIEENNLQDTEEALLLKLRDIKSGYIFIIEHGNILLGTLIIFFTKDYKTLSEDSLEFLRTIAIQAGSSIYQAELYEKIKLQAEREKISRNIVEILRSSIDKTIIKKQFVKNIGKLFKADRVFFSDYDESRGIYMPVDEGCEYLSGPEQKSFTGYDWTSAESIEYINPLLEKRELKIFEWEEYKAMNPKGEGFIKLFEDANVKSSYNFPVLYQDIIMGYFCIEFTKEVHRLSDEDIGRIRSMCSQAGIALYHAKIFTQAQELANMRNICVLKFTNAIDELFESTSKLSEELAKPGIQCENCTLYLNYLKEIITKNSNFINEIQKRDQDS